MSQGYMAAARKLTWAGEGPDMQLARLRSELKLLNTELQGLIKLQGRRSFWSGFWINAEFSYSDYSYLV
jgi:hypothetical protein